MKLDGAYHHLKVEVNRNKFTVESRRAGYVAPQPHQYGEVAGNHAIVILKCRRVPAGVLAKRHK